MISSELIRAWLQAESDVRFVIGELPPDLDEIGTLTMLPGAGLTTDGLWDRPGFQVLIRGRQSAPVSAGSDQFGATGPEAKIRLLDRKIVLGNYPHDLWGARVVWAARAGGAPAPVPGGRDDAERTIYTCNYLCQAALED